MISLTKIGNLKLGIVRSGKPIATERILVTLPTKENLENFKIMNGFKEEGEESVVITLPFDKPELNFEVQYVSFLSVNDVEYIAKSSGIDQPVVLYPLNVEDFDKPSINFGILTEPRIKDYEFKLTGFLKAMLPGVSGFGEVFYLKTHSINTIRSIKDQLAILDALTDHKTAGLPLLLKPIKKDVDGKEIIFVSISYNGPIFGEQIASHFNSRDNVPVSMSSFEKMYEDSRISENVIEFDKLKDPKVTVNSTIVIEDVSKVETEEVKSSKNAQVIFVEEVLKEKGLTKIPTATGIALMNTFKQAGLEEEFLTFLDTPKLSLPLCVKKIKELSSATK